MREPLIYSIKEIEKLIETKASVAEPHLSFISNSKGCGSIVDISLMLPESVIIFVSPAACARHITVYPWQRTGRVFFLEEEEKDIVTGAHLDAIEEAVGDVLATANPRPRLIMIGASCIDRLMSSDIESVAKRLTKKYNVRIEAVWMDPVVGKIHPQQKLWDKVFGMTGESKDEERLPAVNVIGRLRPVGQESEFYRILHEAGIETVRHLAQCRTLEEFYEMGRARLNVVGSPLGVQAAKRMERRNGIPYVEAFPSCHPDNVHEMYRKISCALGVELDDGREYRAAKKRMEEVSGKLRDKTIAVGESYAALINSFQFAVDLYQMGFRVKYIFCDGFVDSKAEEIKWLAAHAPEIQVVIMSHPSMVHITEHPLDVDIAVGTHEDWFYNRPATKWITMERIQHDTDYGSIMRLADMLEQCADEEVPDEEVI